MRSVVGTDVRRFLERFQTLYSQYRHGALYHVQRPLDATLVGQLLCTYPPDRLEAIATELLTASDDPWIAKSDRGIAILATRASWADARLCERQTLRRATLPYDHRWMDDCDRLHEGTCKDFRAHVRRTGMA